MNTNDLVDRIAAEYELTKARVRQLVDAVFAVIAETAAKGDEVALRGFGRFKVADRAARQGRNPATGEIIQIARSRKLAFSAAKPVRDKLNRPVGRLPGSKAKAPTAGRSASARPSGRR